MWALRNAECSTRSGKHFGEQGQSDSLSRLCCVQNGDSAAGRCSETYGKAKGDAIPGARVPGSWTFYFTQDSVPKSASPFSSPTPTSNSGPTPHPTLHVGSSSNQKILKNLYLKVVMIKAKIQKGHSSFLFQDIPSIYVTCEELRYCVSAHC